MEEWFSKFWGLYPTDLCQNKKGPKSVALKSIEKLNPDEKMREKIITNLRELIRYCRLERKADGKTDRWPFASTWINQERWNSLEDVDSYSGLQEKIAASKCSCGKDATVTDKCDACYFGEADKIYDQGIVANLQACGKGRRDGEGISEYRQRLKAGFTKSGYGALVGRG